VFILYNLFRGAASVGVDNSAHIGGLLAGLVLGALVPPVVSGEATAESTAIAALPAQSNAQQGSRATRNAWRILAGSAFVLALALTQLGVKYVSVANYGKAARMAQAGQPDQAINALQQLVHNDPKLVPAALLLGQLFLDEQNPSAAVAPGTFSGA
jgi:predicted Zn-dependent protease